MHNRRAFFFAFAGIPFGVVALAKAEAKPEIAPEVARADTTGHKCHCGSPFHFFEIHEIHDRLWPGPDIEYPPVQRISAAKCMWCRAPWLPR